MTARGRDKRGNTPGPLWGTTLMSVRLAGSRRRQADPGTILDGLEVLPNGDILFTSWDDSSLHLLHGDTDRKLVQEVPAAADIGVDTKRGVLAIHPPSVLGRVQLWSLAGLGSATATAAQ